MIICTIGHEKFVLPDMESATALLKIFDQSTKINTSYLYTQGKHIAYEKACDTSLNIEITTDQQILSAEEAHAIIKADREEDEAKEKAASTAV